MANVQHTCKPCGETMSAESEDALVRTVREHADKEHHKILTESDTRAMIRGERVGQDRGEGDPGDNGTEEEPHRASHDGNGQ